MIKARLKNNNYTSEYHTFLHLASLHLYLVQYDMQTDIASLSFEASQNIVSLGDSLDLAINIFGDQEPIASTDVLISYNPSLLQPILPAKNSGLFESVEAKIVAPGKLYLYGLRRSADHSQTANGNIATITFKAIDKGTTTFKFECETGEQNTSQIIKNSPELTNIINCERTLAHSQMVSVGNAQVLGASDKSIFPLNMWYLTSLVAILTITIFLYIRTKQLAKEETS